MKLNKAVFAVALQCQNITSYSQIALMTLALIVHKQHFISRTKHTLH